MGAELLPAESMNLTVAKGITKRDEPLGPNMAYMLILTIQRLIGEYDWSADRSDDSIEEL
jgi:hypothetical protein